MEKRTVNKNYNRDTFNTMIDKDIQRAFSAKCKEQGMKMNIVLEYFMRGYLNGEFELIMLDKRAMEKAVYNKNQMVKFENVMKEVEKKYDSVSDFEDIKKTLEDILNG